MSSLILTLLACGGPAEPPPAPKAELEDYMRTCMGAGDCTVVATGCCSDGAVAVNKANAEHVKGQALKPEQCAAVTCSTELPKANCEAAKCVLAK